MIKLLFGLILAILFCPIIFLIQAGKLISKLFSNVEEPLIPLSNIENQANLFVYLTRAL